MVSVWNKSLKNIEMDSKGDIWQIIQQAVLPNFLFSSEKQFFFVVRICIPQDTFVVFCLFTQGDILNGNKQGKIEAFSREIFANLVPLYYMSNSTNLTDRNHLERALFTCVLYFPELKSFMVMSKVTEQVLHKYNLPIHLSD